MKTSDFFFDLPPECIARYPPKERGTSRLLLLDRLTGKREHHSAAELPDILAARFSPPPLLVCNNSRVRKARIAGTRLKSPVNDSDISARTEANGSVDDAGGVEFLLLNRIDSHTWRTMVKRTKRRRPGSRYRFGDREAELTDLSGQYKNSVEAGEFRYLRFDHPIDDDWLDLNGHIPLPPYLGRDDEDVDSERYQTVYADRTAASAFGPGASSAAPTAGLHLTEKILGRLAAAGMDTVFLTLHVGPGTFLPVRAERLEDHLMHEESYFISEDAAQRINEAKAAGRKILAVGTTSLRTLESAWRESEGIVPGEGTTALFIYPGYRFRAVDSLFTNFHTPGSTLLMLVSAFAEAGHGIAAAASNGVSAPNLGFGGWGCRLVLESYAEAIREGYRFFSYGDAMLFV